MSIQTTTTVESTFQILDPIVTPPPGTNPLAYLESGLTALTSGVQSKAIVFSVTKVSAYDIIEAEIVNSTDNTPINFGFEFTAITLTGFTILLCGLPDTSHYSLRWTVQVPPS